MALPRRFDPRLKREALLASPIFSWMRPEDLDGLLAFASERVVPRGGRIFGMGDPGGSMMAVLAGQVRLSAASREGREVTLLVVGPGEIFGTIALLDGKPRGADATALERSALLVIERRHFMPFLLRHGELVERLLMVLCERLRRSNRRLEEIALFDLPARLARLLGKLADDYGRPDAGGVRIEMKLSQRDLASLVASTRESVNKQLRLWTREGLLAQQDGYLVLRDPAALQAAGG